MKYCVGFGGYDRMIITGRSYIYRIETEIDGCTLELGILANSQFKVNQMKTYRDGQPEAETFNLVENRICEYESPINSGFKDALI